MITAFFWFALSGLRTYQPASSLGLHIYGSIHVIAKQNLASTEDVYLDLEER
jgi:hypothetical protein